MGPVACARFPGLGAEVVSHVMGTILGVFFFLHLLSLKLISEEKKSVLV